MIVVLWGINGYVQSMAWAPGMSLLSKWWPGNSRGFATGLANGFSGFGQAVSMIAVLISFSLAPKMGWRAAFIFPVLIAVVMAVILCSFIGGICIAAMLFTKNMVIVSALLFIGGFFLYAINGLVWAFAIDVGGRTFSETASGILDFVAYVGASVQAILYGFSVNKGNWNLLFITIAAVCVFMIILAFLAAHGSKHKVKNMVTE